MKDSPGTRLWVRLSRSPLGDRHSTPQVGTRAGERKIMREAIADQHGIDLGFVPLSTGLAPVAATIDWLTAASKVLFSAGLVPVERAILSAYSGPIIRSTGTSPVRGEARVSAAP